MFYSYNDESVRYTGRWGEYGKSFTATAPGSSFEIAFEGEYIVLEFDMDWNCHPYPRIYLSLDGKNKFESVADGYIRVEAQESGKHILTVIFKGTVEMHHRWARPLVGKISFKGYEAEKSSSLPEDNRKTIELIGDSITEGVLVDASHRTDLTNDQNNRVYQDDSTATYAYLTAQNLGLRSFHAAYGATGVTHGGCGGFPDVLTSYNYCFENCPVSYASPDYILINHGANDRGASAQEYTQKYSALLDIVREKNPSSKIICVSAFCGCYPAELGAMIKKYNEENGTDILYVDATGFVPLEPLHPLRDGHRIISQKLTQILRKELEL